MNRCSSRTVLLGAVLFGTAACLGFGAEPAASVVGDPYPLTDCIILDLDLEDGQKPHVIVEQKREIRVCCEDCISQFYQDRFRWLAKIDRRIVEQQRPRYPLDRCIVDDGPLQFGSFDFVFGNRLFRLCSGACREKLEKEPAKYFGKLDFAVIEKQGPKYPLDKSVVSGKPLGDDAVDYVIANRLIRLASFDEIDRLNQAPGKYLKTLEKAWKKNRKRSRVGQE